MSQTPPTINDVKRLAKERRQSELRRIWQRAELEGRKVFVTLDMGRVEQVKLAKRDSKAGKAGEIICPESAILICLEGDRKWQPLPHHTPSAERKKADADKRKNELKAKAARDHAHSAASN